MKHILMTMLSSIVLFTSCATITGGPVSDCQRTKPAPGEPARKIRTGALICDICLGGGPLIIDFATKAIYKPCK